MNTTDISKEAREASEREIEASMGMRDGEEQGYFVQQAIDTATAELREQLKQEQESNWTASLCDRVNELLREHRVMGEVSNGSDCSMAITAIHGYCGSLVGERDTLKIEYESRAIWIAKMLKALGCENHDGFHCVDAHEVAGRLRAENEHLRLENDRLREALRSIQSFPVHSEPVGGAMAMQDIACNAMSPQRPCSSP